jgi:deoxyribose-phosphate aldolase
MNKKQMAAMIDHTILKAVATRQDVEKLCAEAVAHGFASVCVNPIHVPLAAKLLAGSSVEVCTVVGFPLGATSYKIKAQEAAWAVQEGATEVDMVIDVGAAKEGRFDDVESDIAGVVAASKPAIVKVILEVCYLTEDEIVSCCKAAVRSGAHFVKTSTGFGDGGATVEAVSLMRKTVGPDIGVKAAGGIRSAKDALAMVEAGANRIGCSAGLAIMAELE